ncbi:hypothetical protein ACFLRU_05170 [Bacteroidota bacterium]
MSLQKIAFIFCLLVLLIACKKEKLKIVEKEEPSVAIRSQFHMQKTFLISDSLSVLSKMKVERWAGYQNLSEFLKNNFTRISPNNSLELSKELYTVVKKVRDSFKIKELNVDGVTARINVLSSEALRLKDMSDISSIKSEEIVEQTQKILNVYSSINSKINAIYAQMTFDEDVNFDESIFEFREPMKRSFPKPTFNRNSKKLPR